MVRVLTAPRARVAGRYLANGAPAWAAPFARDEAKCADLWERATALLGIDTHASLA